MDLIVDGDADGVEHILRKGVNPNQRDGDGMTPLHRYIILCLDDGSWSQESMTIIHLSLIVFRACVEGHLKIVTALMNHGAAVNSLDDDWWTPLHAAAAAGFFNYFIVKLIFFEKTLKYFIFFQSIDF